MSGDRRRIRTLLVDNYDSFTYNLFQLIGIVNCCPPTVIRNDELDPTVLDLSGFDNIVISPGPGRPDVARDFGLSRYLVDHAELPLLGVCLGHQGIVLGAGGAVVAAPAPRHGFPDRIHHDGRDLFEDLPDGFTAVRYHSLCAATPLPEALEATATASDGVVMGIRHRTRPQWGVQFHPESVSSEHGAALLRNFARLTERFTAEPATSAPATTRSRRRIGPREPCTPRTAPRHEQPGAGSGEPATTGPGEPPTTAPHDPRRAAPGESRRAAPHDSRRAAPGESSTATTGEPATATTDKPVTARTGEPATGGSRESNEAGSGEPAITWPGEPPATAPHNPRRAGPGEWFTATTGEPATATTGQPATATTGEPATATTGQPATARTGEPATGGSRESNGAGSGEPATTGPGEPPVTAPHDPHRATPGESSTATTGEPATATTGEPATARTGESATGGTREPNGAGSGQRDDLVHCVLVAPADGAAPPGGRPIRLFDVLHEVVDHTVDAEEAFARQHEQADTAFWLDSALTEAGAGRFSYLGDADGPAAEVVRYRVGEGFVRVDTPAGERSVPGTVLDYLAVELVRRRIEFPDVPFDFVGGYVGYLGYEVKADCGASAAHRSPTPDAVWVFADRLVVVDHHEARTHLIALCEPESAVAQEEWMAVTRSILESTTCPPDRPRSSAADTKGSPGRTQSAADTEPSPGRTQSAADTEPSPGRAKSAAPGGAAGTDETATQTGGLRGSEEKVSGAASDSAPVESIPCFRRADPLFAETATRDPGPDPTGLPAGRGGAAVTAPAIERAGTDFTTGIGAGDLAALAAGLSRGRDRYLADIADIRAALRAGETYEVTLTDQVAVADPAADPASDLAVYRALRRSNPAPYAAFLRFGETVVACSSPERFLKITRDRSVESKPIKGTAPRGREPATDENLRRALELDPKTRAENLMIVDLLRNDLGRVCELGSVYVPELMAVETYATLHQLVSTVRGRLRPEVSVIDCVRACFPGGSMTGAPKLRTTEIIDGLETEARGVYSGTLGFLGLGGTADLNIVIRTAVRHQGRWRIGAGGAIVLDSDAAAEFDEMVLKAAAPVRAVRGQVSQAPTGGGIQPGSRPNQPASRS
ncbi:chorismate-binding protein [Nocardia aurantia]|uniref:aminodeoxychorismate synthase n=1 Tax=Nocardia aurantia TaxID=2585199 RepID=A0A7K0DIV7_9NOCA|nr:chorismate-binding protein [Nocardia aurantia]MQY25740.1 Isochorismate synthase MenF [Nocardia aurantia]